MQQEFAFHQRNSVTRKRGYNGVFRWPLLTAAAVLAICLFRGVEAFASERNSAQPLIQPLNVMTLNLHGYHPMGMEERVLESLDGEKRRANSYLTYFSFDEIRAGHNRQIETLAKTLTQLPESDKPEILLLQEVGAGLPDSPKDCAEFYAKPQTDFFGKNSSLRLQSHLLALGEDYQAELACRGNIGWQTDSNTFGKERVRLKSGAVVFDFGSNPYPHGFLVEGTAILVRKPTRILDQRVDWLPVDGTNERVFLQFARIQRPGRALWLLVANLHGPHKIRHFEYALTARKHLEAYIESHPERSNFGGMIVGGDFNATLARPSRKMSEVSTIPWEVSVPGEFDFSDASREVNFKALEDKLWAQNIDPLFKPWASIGKDSQARSRVSAAVQMFRDFVRSPRRNELRESFDQLKLQANPSACLKLPTLNSSCSQSGRIDHLFASPSLKPLAGAIAYSQNNFYSLDGTTDHPGIYVRYLYGN